MRWRTRFPLFHTVVLHLSSQSGWLSLGTCLILLAGSAPRAFAYEVSATTTAQLSSSLKALIEVRSSPVVYIPGPTISVQVHSLKPVTPRVPELILRRVQETLPRDDPRLRVSSAAPDTSITCTITDLGVSSGIENRTRSEYQKIGETMVTDPTTGLSRTEDQYGYVDVPYRALVIQGRMSVQCDVKDTATGILLYSDVFDAVYTDPREAGYGSSASVEDLGA